MKIKKVEIVPVKPNNGLIGFAHILFEEGLFLGSIGIFKKLDGSGFRLTYPNRKVGQIRKITCPYCGGESKLKCLKKSAPSDIFPYQDLCVQCQNCGASGPIKRLNDADFSLKSHERHVEILDEILKFQFCNPRSWDFELLKNK